MPCNSDHLEPFNRELELSRVACLLDELKGITWNKSSWNGYHPKVYNQHISKSVADGMIAELCKKIRQIDVSEYSLELQIWWRDHQKVDALRKITENT